MPFFYLHNKTKIMKKKLRKRNITEMNCSTISKYLQMILISGKYEINIHRLKKSIQCQHMQYNRNISME